MVLSEEKVITRKQVEKAQKRLSDYIVGKGGSYNVALFDLFCKADLDDLVVLSRAYPAEVYVYALGSSCRYIYDKYKVIEEE